MNQDTNTLYKEILDKVTKERDTYLKRGIELSLYPSHSKEVNEVYTAFAQAQAEFPPISKAVQGYGYKYAPLDVVLKAVIPLLSKHGLIFTQYTTRENYLHTRIGHTSGQFFESQCRIPLAQEDPSAKKSFLQEIGSRKTYMRRYEALAILGIQPEAEDDDNARPGNSTTSRSYN